MKRRIYPSDNLIYNRYDLIMSQRFVEFAIDNGSDSFRFQYYTDNDRTFLNVWGKEFPQDVFDKAIEHVFKNEAKINAIEIRAAGNNYKEQLDETTDVEIELNHGTAAIETRLSSKGRYNLKREMRCLNNACGDTKLVKESAPIDDDTIRQYFEWKKETHGRDYGMTPEKYVEKYHVNGVIRLLAGSKCISMVLFCKCEDTVYVENLSYNPEYSKYSPGTLVYYFFLLEMEKEGINYVFLGRSGLDYKKRFGSVESRRFDGTIYRKEVFDKINNYFDKQGIHDYAIYGLGKCGNRFFRLRDSFNATLLFGIDQKVNEFNGIKVVRPNELNKENKPCIVIITMEARNKEIERNLEDYNCRSIYLDDLINEIGCVQ